MTTTRIEVETLTNFLTGYVPELASFASGGGLIRIPNNGNIGTVTHNFNLASGKYDIVVAYFDEGDGQSPFTLKQKTANQNWTNLATWTASGNTNTSDSRASASNLTLFKQSGVNLTTGDEIQVQGQLNSGEPARVDYIEYISLTADTTAPTATATANDTTLTSGSNSSYTFTVTYSDDQAVKVSSFDNQDIRVTGPNGFDQLATFVSVNTNSDGTPRTATYSIPAPGGSWDSSEAGSYSVAIAANQVSDTSNNTAVSGILDTFNVNVQTSTATLTQIVITEAESMALAGGYRRDSASFASGGALITQKGGVGTTATATTGFTGASGAYDIVVKYFDENDGVVDFSLGVQGTTVGTWKADQNLGSSSASAKTLTEKVLKNIQINTSDKIEIKGTVNAAELARVDRIDFIPTDDAAATPSLTANNIDVTSGNSQDYTFTVQYSDDWGVKLFTIDSKDIKVTGPNGFSKDATLVSSSLSSDGKVATATYRIAPPGGYWNIPEAGTYTIEMQSNQVLDLVNNPVPAGNLGTFNVSVNSSGDNVNYSQATKGVYVNLETEIGSIPDPSKTLKVMPLGDSITAGKENSKQLEADWVGYRKALYEDFNFFNVPVDFVGSGTNGAFSENQHEGHPGWTISQIQQGKSTEPGTGVNNWLPTYTPNVVLLMIGTNDAGGSASKMKTSLDSLIKTITANSSFNNGDLLVSTIAPIHPQSSYYAARMPNVIEYNKSIPDIVAQQPASEKVSFVNMWQGSNALLETDMTPPPADNGLHPTQAGYQKMAYHWFDSILSNTQQKDILPDKTNVQGSAYNDMIFGNASSNNLEGGEGADQITGGAGGDTFTYNNPNQGQDILTDFNPSQGDIFAISASGFGAGLVAGTALSTTASSTGVFASGTTLNYLGDMAHFFYNTSTGLVSFDPDGSNAQPLTPLATLTTKPTLTANQFMIV